MIDIIYSGNEVLPKFITSCMCFGVNISMSNCPIGLKFCTVPIEEYICGVNMARVGQIVPIKGKYEQIR